MFKILSFISVLGFSFSALALEVDTANSQFKWTGTKVTGQHYGTIPLKSATVKDDKGQIKGGEFVIDITQMTCDDLTGEYKDKFLTHMKSPDFFEVEKWPTAKLVINKLDGKMAHGQLTIKDKTKNVKVPYTKEGNKFKGTFVFDRTQFGMIYGSGNFFKNLGDKMIHNDVKLEFTVATK